MSDGFTSPEHGPEVFDVTESALSLATATEEIFSSITLDVQALSVNDITDGIMGNIDADEAGCIKSTFTVQQTLGDGVCVILSISDYLDLDLDPEEPTVDVLKMLSLQLVRTTDRPGLGKITERSDFHVNLTDAQEAIEYPDRLIEVDVAFQHSFVDENGVTRKRITKMAKHDVDSALMLLAQTRPGKWRAPVEPSSADQPVKIRLSDSTQDYLDKIDTGGQSVAQADTEYMHEEATVSDESIKNTRWLLAGLAGFTALVEADSTPDPVRTIMLDIGYMSTIPPLVHAYKMLLRWAKTD